MASTDSRDSVKLISPVCKRLRNKQMYMDIVPDPTVPDTNDGFHWCFHTQNCLGPDGELAEPENCLNHRPCYEDSLQ